MLAVVGRSPIGELKPGEEENENHKRAAFQDSLPFHKSREQRSRNRVLELSSCHSVIVNYITIARASFFLKKFFEAISLRSNVKSLLEWKVGDREAAITPREARALACAYLDSA